MSVQVVLNIPEDVYQQAESLAQATNQDRSEILADAIVLDKPARPLSPKQRAMASEQAAYQALHPKLLAESKSKFVAIYGGRMVDQDQDQTTLLLRIREHYMGAVVLVTQVLPEAEENYTFRSPRLENGF